MIVSEIDAHVRRNIKTPSWTFCSVTAPCMVGQLSTSGNEETAMLMVERDFWRDLRARPASSGTERWPHILTTTSPSLDERGVSCWLFLPERAQYEDYESHHACALPGKSYRGLLCISAFAKSRSPRWWCSRSFERERWRRAYPSIRQDDQRSSSSPGRCSCCS